MISKDAGDLADLGRIALGDGSVVGPIGEGRGDVGLGRSEVRTYLRDTFAESTAEKGHPSTAGEIDDCEDCPSAHPFIRRFGR